MTRSNSVAQDDHVGDDLICYRIRCLENDRRYIGITYNFKERMRSHFATLRLGKHNCKSLQRDYNLFGVDSFVTEVVYQAKFIDSYQKKIIEKVALSIEKNLYNTNAFIEFKSFKKIPPTVTLEWNVGGELVFLPINKKNIMEIHPKLCQAGSFTIKVPGEIPINKLRVKFSVLHGYLNRSGKIFSKIKTHINRENCLIYISITDSVATIEKAQISMPL